MSANAGMNEVVSAGGLRGVGRSLALIAGDIKIAHSVFALPFAVLGAFLAAWTVAPFGGEVIGGAGSVWRSFLGKLGLVVVCMVFARTWAMLFNRLVDREIDAGNERTKRRIFASGALSASRGWGIALACAAGFVGAAGLFWVFFQNAWPVVLSVPVLVWIAFYSLTKRFTALCHVFLGGALAVSPIAAAIAVSPGAVFGSERQVVLLWIAGFVMAWVAGFDVIYALQDEAFDRAKGLNSVPAKLGTNGAVWVSRALHAAALLCIAMAWRSDARFGWIFGAGVIAVAGLLLWEHWIVLGMQRRGDRVGLDIAFFTINGIASCVLGTLGVVDVLVA